MAFDTARVSIITSDTDYEVSLEHGTKLLSRWHAKALDSALGQVVGEKLSASPHRPKAKAIIFCIDLWATLDRVDEVAAGLPAGYELVACMPDRRNCPGSCRN